MKNKFFRTMVTTACVVFAFAAAAAAQDNEPLVGGYGKIPVKSAEATVAAIAAGC